VLEHKALDFTHLVRFDSSNRRKGNRIKPELAFAVSDMDVRRLFPFIGIEVKSVRTDSHYRWHSLESSLAGVRDKAVFAQRQR
jgi:hypothetical protein